MMVIFFCGVDLAAAEAAACLEAAVSSSAPEMIDDHFALGVDAAAAGAVVAVRAAAPCGAQFDPVLVGAPPREGNASVTAGAEAVATEKEVVEGAVVTVLDEERVIDAIDPAEELLGT